MTRNRLRSKTVKNKQVGLKPTFIMTTLIITRTENLAFI